MELLTLVFPRLEGVTFTFISGTGFRRDTNKQTNKEASNCVRRSIKHITKAKGYAENVDIAELPEHKQPRAITNLLVTRVLDTTLTLAPSIEGEAKKAVDMKPQAVLESLKAKGIM